MVPGVEVTIGDTKYTLPPINLAMRRAHKEFLSDAVKFAEGAVAPTNDDVLRMGEVIEASLKRNYPDIPFAKFEPDLDDEKLLECFIAILTAGRAGPQTGEPKQPGKP